MPPQVMHPVTAEELFASPRRRDHELVSGVLHVSEPPGGVHGRLATRLAHRLHAHVEQQGLGTVLVETGYVLRRDPDTVRGPDISFVRTARIPPHDIPEHFIDGPPDLAVEILSPDGRSAEMQEKLRDYFAGGTRMVWVVDPDRRRVTVWRGDGAAARIAALGEELDGEDVVPGFRCPVAEVFGAGTDG